MAIYQIGEARPHLPASGNYWVAENAQVMGNVILMENASVWYADAENVGDALCRELEEAP